MAGKTVVITGGINDPRSGEKVPRPTFQRLCEKAGATTASSVSATTDLLITGADVGASKLTKAEKLGVEVKDQGEIWPLLINAGDRLVPGPGSPDQGDGRSRRELRRSGRAFAAPGSVSAAGHRTGMS